MKNINKIISIFIIIFIISSITFNVSSNQDHIIQKNLDSIKFSISFSNPSIEKFQKDNVIIHKVKIDGLSNTYDLNKPIIPVKSLKILIPYDKVLDKIEVNDEGGKLIKSGINLEFGQKLIPTSPFSPGRSEACYVLLTAARVAKLITITSISSISG